MRERQDQIVSRARRLLEDKPVGVTTDDGEGGVSRGQLRIRLLLAPSRHP
jgi:hypothetical protein